MTDGSFKYRALDVYRFLAAALVAIGHFDDAFRLGLAAYSPLAVRFGLFVDFFFILSGFVIALNYGEQVSGGQVSGGQVSGGQVSGLAAYGDFLWRRLARLWPLHLVVLAFFGGLGFIGHLVGYRFQYPEAFDLSGLPWNILLMQAWGPVWHMSFNVASWSISAELFVYLLFPVFAMLGRRLPLALNLALIAVTVLAMATWRREAGLAPWYQATFDLGMLRAVPSFFLGVLIQRQTRPRLRRPAVSWPLAHGCFLLALVAIHLDWPAEIVILLFAAFVYLAALAEQRQPGGAFSGPLAERLGQASYGLYMVHMPLMTCGIFVMRRTTGYEGHWGFAFAAATFALALALALFLFRHLEDPARRWLNAASPFRRAGQGGAAAGKPAQPHALPLNSP